MAATVVVVRPAQPERFRARQLAPYAVFAGAALFMLLYLVGIEQGPVSLIGGNFVHELVHDGRHLIGVPCH